MTKPNILLICTDQHRHDYLGYNGASWLRTPNLDQLAANGAVFTHAYTNSPICAPARCSLATGLLPHRFGRLNNQHYVPERLPTFYQRLRDGGYWTGFVGKLDLQKIGEQRQVRRDGRLPLHARLGFCEPCHFEGSMLPIKEPSDPYSFHLAERGLLEAQNRDRQARSLLPGLVDVAYYGFPPVDLANAGLPKDWVARVSQDSPFSGIDHADGFCGSRAVEWINDVSAERPWFLQANFFGPHDPFDPPPDFAARYRGAAVPDPIPADYTGKPRQAARRFITDDLESIRFTRRQYCALIEHLDFWIGKLLETLKARAMLENTVIIFTSDHGEMLGDFGLYIKSVPYEASARVPLLLSGPGIPRGLRSDALVELLDLNATCCELAGLTPHDNLDSRSLVPFLRQPENAAPHRETVLFEEYHYVAIRNRRWKYANWYNDLEEIYDLENDPEERHNLLGDPAGQKAHADLRWEMVRQINRRTAEGGWSR
jgi:choline-sulfatase